MRSLLETEWLKLRHYRTFWVLMGLFVLLLPLWNYEVANGLIKIGGGEVNGPNFFRSAYSFPQVWGNIGFWGSYFIWFLSILVIIITTNEYTYRTNRQNVIDGWTRTQFFHAKIFLVVVFALLATVYLFVLGIIFGSIYSGSLSSAFSEIQQVLYFFILSLDYLGFALLIALWVRRSGFAIGLFLLYAMIIESILKGILNNYGNQSYGNFLPLQASDELLPFPLLQIAKPFMNLGPTISTTTYAFVALCWCAIYYIAGRTLLLKSDW